MNKKVIRLTENDLHRIIKETTMNILKENDMQQFHMTLDNQGNVGLRNAKQWQNAEKALNTSNEITISIPFNGNYLESRIERTERNTFMIYGGYVDNNKQRHIINTEQATPHDALKTLQNFISNIQQKMMK